MIIDAHAHLWKTQTGRRDNAPVRTLRDGLSDFGGEIKQMMPPYMVSGENSPEMLIANMNYAGVNGAVIVGEVMDGNQNEYFKAAKEKYPNRLKICAFFDEGEDYTLDGFDGIKICACKLKTPGIQKHFDVFENAYKSGKFVCIELEDGDAQTGELEEIIRQLPDLKIAIGHFGMVTRDGWEEQIKLARYKNVFVESGGITWLFNSEFYPYPSAIRAIQTAADICGFDKLMWGSDYPRTMVEITYKMSFDFVLKSEEISDADKAKFLFENARNFYGFDGLQELDIIPNML
ncbi:MAG: amidohydrolase [Ruminococcaceae bacterium]|nr:amidohydrolase [Oscillospiraceae bacterium]